MKNLFGVIPALILMASCFTAQAASIDPGISEIDPTHQLYTIDTNVTSADASKEAAVTACTESCHETSKPLAMAGYPNDSDDPGTYCMACNIDAGSHDYLVWSQEPPDYGEIRVI